MTDRKAIECIDGMGFTSYKEFTALVIAQEALREREERSKGCEWCCDEILLDGEDMELELQHPLEDAPRMVYPNFCPMCGRPLKGADDGTD